ncbi:MAG: hypothetical protein RL726_1947 [Actinomycetota bacterium]
MRVPWCVVLLGLVACGGGTGAVTGDPPAEVSRPTDPPVSTTVIAPGVEIDDTEIDDTEIEIATAFDQLMDARLACGRRPRACRVDDLAIDGSPMHHELTVLMESRIRAGIVASERGSLRYRIDDARVDGDVAAITTCLYDDIVLTMDGSIFDESTMSAITEWTMARSANGWRWSDWRVIDSTREGDLCGFVG